MVKLKISSPGKSSGKASYIVNLAIIFFTVPLLLPRPAIALGPGEAAKNTVMRLAPEAAADEVAKLKQGLKLTAIERRGFWYRVETEGGGGWVKLSDVKLASSESAGAGLAAMATGRGATGNVVSTSGTRGLSAEDLSGAKPDEAALAQVQSMAISPEEAAKYADEGGLSPRQLEYVSAPTTRKKGRK